MRFKRLLSVLGAALVLCAAPAWPVAQQAVQAGPANLSNSSPAAHPKRSSSKRRRTRHQRGQKAPTPERIKEIQVALAREDFFQGEPNGKWDAASVQAMKRFQTAHGLTPTGKLDALSLQKLGLGSETAGQAAPRPTAQPPSSHR